MTAEPPLLAWRVGLPLSSRFIGLATKVCLLLHLVAAVKIILTRAVGERGSAKGVGRWSAPLAMVEPVRGGKPSSFCYELFRHDARPGSLTASALGTYFLHLNPELGWRRISPRMNGSNRGQSRGRRSAHRSIAVFCAPLQA